MFLLIFLRLSWTWYFTGEKWNHRQQMTIFFKKHVYNIHVHRVINIISLLTISTQTGDENNDLHQLYLDVAPKFSKLTLGRFSKDNVTPTKNARSCHCGIFWTQFDFDFWCSCCHPFHKILAAFCKFYVAKQYTTVFKTL